MYRKHNAAFNHFHISAFWSTLGKHVKRSRSGASAVQRELRDEEALFSAARTQTIKLLPTLGAREISNVAHGLATAGLGSNDAWTDLWQELEDAAIVHLDGFNQQGLANTAWAFATARHPVSELHSAMAPRIISDIGEFAPQGIANTAWSFATASIQDSADGIRARPSADQTMMSVFEAIEQEVGGRGVSGFKAQELCNLLWSFATVNVSAPAVFELCADGIVERLEECVPQTVANTLWSFATTGHQSPKLLQLLQRSQRPMHIDITRRRSRSLLGRLPPSVPTPEQTSLTGLQSSHGRR